MEGSEDSDDQDIPVEETKDYQKWYNAPQEDRFLKLDSFIIRLMGQYVSSSPEEKENSTQQTDI